MHWYETFSPISALDTIMEANEANCRHDKVKSFWFDFFFVSFVCIFSPPWPGLAVAKPGKLEVNLVRRLF